MNDIVPVEEQQVEEVHLSLAQKTSIFLPTAFIADAFFASAHAPLPITIGATIGAFMLAKNSHKIAGALKQYIPAEIMEHVQHSQENTEERHANGEWSVVDRLMGRHLRVSDPQENGPLPFPSTSAVVDADPVEDNTLSTANKYDHLLLGETFQPHASTILSHRIGIFGIPGSGKSNALTAFIEEIGHLNGVGVPFLLCDTEDEYKALHSLRYLARPYSAGAHNVTPENAFYFGQDLLERGRQVVLNLQGYESEDDAALVMIGIVEGMRAWEEAHENEDRAASFVILDEASAWLPQRVEESPLSKEKDENKMTVLAKLQRAFFRNLVKRGRKRGMGFVFATPRPADLDKRAISCDWFFLFRQTFPNDLAVYARLGVEEATARGLQPGQCIVLNPADDCEVHQFRKRRSPDNSATPGTASLQKYKDKWAQDDTPIARAEQHTAQDSQRLQPSYSDDQMELIQRLVAKSVETTLQAVLGHNLSGGNTPFPVSTDELPDVSNSENNRETSGNGSTSHVSGNAKSKETLSSKSESTVDADNSSSKVPMPDVPPETIRIIKNMRAAKMSDRNISELVDMTGRKYTTYKQIVQWINQQEA